MIDRLIKENKVLVFGTFDGIHRGHIHFLKEAKKLGCLTVSVASNESIKKRKMKTPSRNTKQRIKEIKKLGIADKVRDGDRMLNQWSEVRETKPDIVAVGYDQKELTKALKTIQNEFGFKIKKIGSYMPKKFHSSIIKKQLSKLKTN